MKQMIIKKSLNCVVAEHLVNGQPEQEIIKLFGTHILPLPYTEQADLEIIKQELIRLNPGYKIEVEK